MSAEEIVAQDAELPVEDTAIKAERAAYVSGLRQVAAFIEAHPDLPLPYAGAQNAFVTKKSDLATIARVSGVNWKKAANNDFFYIRVCFDGGHSYEINVSREQVCRKVVTGTRIEPAQPEREVEEFHWVCDEPLLASHAY